MHNINVMTISQLVSEFKKDATAVAICDHKMVDEPSEPGRFSIAQTHRVSCVPVSSEATDGEKLTQANFGSTLPKTLAWKTEHMDVLYTLRKTQKGIMPVMPSTQLLKAVTIPAGKALCLSP